MARKPRDYAKEYKDYHAKPEQKKRRAERNRDRAAAEKKGLVHKGDNLEVDHVGNNRKGDLSKRKTRVVTQKVNARRQPKRT